MRASYKWLKELCRFEATPEEVAERLTAAGLEVEGQKRFGDLPSVVIAEVRGKRPHPQREKLSLVTVFDGEAELEVVCGAPNVPAPGKRILFARSGAKLPNGMVIAERKLGGVTSNGMICSESELEIGTESDGIFVVPDELKAEPGTSVSTALGLDDVVFEIGLTPNRPDCLGHVGLARELTALLGAPLALPRVEVPAALRQPSKAPEGTRAIVLFEGSATVEAGSHVRLTVEDTQRCPRYATAVIEGVSVGPSPFWLRYRLHVLGLRSINSVVDVTNLVLLEFGYPTHAFDLEHVRGGSIEVRRARAGEQIVTLDGQSRALTADDLLICDAERPLAVAGVMGGFESGVTEQTKRVLVECAYFEPRTVRRSSRRLGLHTDASHRFERGVDPRAVPGVLARVVSLIAGLASGATTAQGYEVYDSPIAPAEMQLRSSRLRALLGAEIPLATAQRILETLGCEVELRGGEVLRVRAPTWRPDLTREEDLVEEVARVWGYDRIPTEVPSIRPSLEEAEAPTRFLRQLKERAAAVGLTEAVNLAFVSAKQLESARAPLPAVKVVNPLSEERSFMRTSLLPGLAQNVLRAQRHQVSRVALFELARVFHPSDEVLPVERHQLALILAGTRAEWVGSAAPYDFYDAKGLLESIVLATVGAPLQAALDPALEREYPCLHPKRSARVLAAGLPIGVIGELHPDVLDALELSGPVIYAELELQALLATRAEHVRQLRPVPRFPASSRDLSVEVDESAQAGTVAAALREAGGRLVEAVELFDLYRGGQLKPGHKSLAFRITYRDPEGTLTDARVDEVHARVTDDARRRFAAALRA